ncbi:MAG: glycosyl transferase family protein [Rhodospirillaceae bacterium]|jgi:anthranilate phosphoribosyltransferase|nr:glycosyl transferase family protein [Rhodospirillaceae bacterium]MBT5244143.1 glycosyl transferase family protein [Rhodospirillaceae bacterium]MBT5561668.1 glycosyl transferase family protein [Rhodospirillaceae bacterium]MBT6243107.1 glycosyl transferase family protein [Rhodospirillaceae bacterium]MBT7137865.1 glycosyl transferase family protein [Rhodospirillaceae bacterium]
MTEEHPFAQYVRIIGKGPNLSRPLSGDEMYQAATMIMRGEIEPLQLGAFLCILRMRTEVPEEGAGFVRAVRDTLELPQDIPEVDLDWSSYSGKKRQLPWFLLAAQLLAQSGVRIFMQGTEGHTPDRVYSREALQSLGIPIAGSLSEAAEHIRKTNFGFLPLAQLSPKLQEIIDLKPVLGLRSPVNTFGRMVNPFNAAHEIQTVFHPNYRDVHRDTANLLGQKHMAVFKGEGGEVERRPQKPVEVQSLHNGVLSEEEWPALLPEDSIKIDEDMNLERLKTIWSGEEQDTYATAAVTGTAAIVLRLLGRADSPADATTLAEKMWTERNTSRLGD